MMIWTMKFNTKHLQHTSNHMRMVQILHPTKIYTFNDWQMCFLRQEGDDEFYKRLINDIPPIFTRFIFNLHQYPEAMMQRASVTAWAWHPELKDHPSSPDQNPWVPSEGMIAKVKRKQDKLNCQLTEMQKEAEAKQQQEKLKFEELFNNLHAHLGP